MLPGADQLANSQAEELLARARGGDAEAFCAILQTQEARLLRQALGMCGNQPLAEDLVCETMAEAWRCLHRYDGSCRLSTWLFSILLHRFQKHARSAKSRPVPISNLPIIEHPPETTLAATELSPAEDLMRKEAGEEIRGLLEQLAEKHREVLLMRFFQEASLEEMAATLGCPIGTVKSRLHYALDALRRLRTDLNPEAP